MHPWHRRTSSVATRTATPVLSPSTATIGPKGGTLTSADGKVSLSIPAGAFAADTVVGIQPTTNAPEETLGLAYQLTPEGVTFPQPVTLAWHLSDDDLAKNSIDNLYVATRTANGTWEDQPGAQRDEATHTVSVAVSHFSLWALAQTLRIAPSESKVYAREFVLLTAAVGTFPKQIPPAPDVGPKPPAPKPPDDDLHGHGQPGVWHPQGLQLCLAQFGPLILVRLCCAAT